MATGSYLSVITLNENGLNAPTKRQRLAEWIKKTQGSFQRSSNPHGHIPCLERQEKGISFEEREKLLSWKGDFMKRDVG